MEVIVADKQPSTEEQDHPMTEEFEPLISDCESQNGETNEEVSACWRQPRFLRFGLGDR